MPLNHTTSKQEFQVPSAANAPLLPRWNVVENYAKKKEKEKRGKEEKGKKGGKKESRKEERRF